MTSFRLVRGLRVEDLGVEVVVLDAILGRVHRLTGPAAVAVRASVAGRTVAAHAAGVLTDVGIMEQTGGPGRSQRADPDRRAVLAASALGVATFLLPHPGAAASPGGLSEGGSAYLDVTGMSDSSMAGVGQLQFVTYTATSGTRTAVPSTELQVEVLLVGGGGGGAASGGGGGGGAVTRSIVTLDGGVTYDVVVGAGGTGSAAFTQAAGSAGAASTLTERATSTELLRAAAGGGGSYYGDGAGGSSTYAGGSGTGIGYAPENGFGGGGGAGGTGGSAVAGAGGDGGAGVTISNFVGADQTYGGGGGGGGVVDGGDSGTGGGGTGGLGDGEGAYTAGGAGIDGRGGGGGGGAPYAAGGDGGDGLVMIRYYGAQPAVNLGFPAV